MSEIQQLTTNTIHPARPIIVMAEIVTDEGQDVGAIGASNLTRKRAENIAIERAKSMMEKTDLGYKIKYARAWLISEAHINDTQYVAGGSWMKGAETVALRGNQVEIEATRNGEKFVNVTGKSFLSAGRALENAIVRANKRIDSIDT